MNKTTKLIFTLAFTIIIFGLTFYWLFANRVEPVILGLPFGLFFITLLIIIEFVLLVVLYRFEQTAGDKSENSI